MWKLALAAVLLPLAANILKWRKDVRRIHERAASLEHNGEARLSAGSSGRVSFLIAAWQEADTLPACLDAIARLDYPDLEIVLCAGGGDGTWESASRRRDARLVLLRQLQGEGKQKALQRCLEKATGEIVYLLDADCRVSAGAFERLAGPILRGEEDAVTSCPCAPDAGQRSHAFVVSQCASRAYTALYQARYARGLWGANSVVRREVLERAGGFDCGARAGGDYDLGLRLMSAGTRIRHLPEAMFAIVFHTDASRYLRQQARWLRNVTLHGIRYRAYGPAAKALRTSLVGLAMIGLPVAALVSGWRLGAASPVALVCGAAWVFAFWHATLSRIRYAAVAARWPGLRIPWRTIAFIPVYLMLDFAAWTLALAQYSRKEWRQGW